MRPWYVFAFGSVLVAVALFERVWGFRSGRQYVLCHASAALDHGTFLALGLVAGAFGVACAGAAAGSLGGRPARPLFLLVCMLAVLGLVVAADRVDAGGERRAAELASAPLDERSCDYAPQVYSATPGWFSW
ncbi:hypothetical protein ACFU3J_03865 [Streptomyces sp. NPDC057411]|uniref:hypothetical protein n=1 Tax=unclassified Streptomyces TaxID=2593676 RepID=UPI0036351508